MPSFNHPNEAIILYCNDCKKCGMIDIKHKKRMTCNLTKGNKRYSNRDLFPNHPKAIKARSSKQ